MGRGCYHTNRGCKLYTNVGYGTQIVVCYGRMVVIGAVEGDSGVVDAEGGPGEIAESDWQASINPVQYTVHVRRGRLSPV